MPSFRVTVLKAHVPICKTFRNYTKEPYPNIYLFKSSDKHLSTIEQLYELIKQTSSTGACLLKGELDRELDWESRAGHTDPNKPTFWVCLDVDYLPSTPTVDNFLHKLGVTDISYVLQYSASYGVHGNLTLRAHLFFLLDQPQSPKVLKYWLKQLNLQIFTDDLVLTRTNMALRWGLDITTCQSDKLIYVTPPVCHPSSINQFTGERIVLVKKASDHLTLPTTLLTVEQIKLLEEAKINELRKRGNLEPRKSTNFQTKEHKGVAYLAKPDQALVTSVKHSRDFVYLNLNGGDSWGYYHPIDNPLFIYNFKGEPTYRTQELVPEYWYEIIHTRAQVQTSQNRDKMFLAFRDRRTASYFNGYYDSDTDELTLDPARSERQLNDFLANNGITPPDSIPIWDIVYEPLQPPINLNTQTVNLFRPSRYMREAIHQPDHQPFPTIDRLTRHVLGPGCIQHWYNWLAFVYQQRVAPGTAWVLHGVPGIGKGVLFSRVLTPLLGLSNVVMKRMEELEDRFNSYLENCLLCFVDEAQVSDSGRYKIIMANLKNQITEPRISIRRMHTHAYEVNNHIGWIFASNMPDAVLVAPNDRRFNVGEYQAKPIQLTTADFTALEAELLDFATFLRLYQVNEVQVRTPLLNTAREQLILISRPSADIVAQALLDGQLNQLWDSLPLNDFTSTNHAEQDAYYAFRALLHRIVKEQPDRLSREDLHIIFLYCVGHVPASPNKFSSYLKHHGIELKVVRFGPKLGRGILVAWQDSPDWFAERLAEVRLSEQVPTTLKVVK